MSACRAPRSTPTNTPTITNTKRAVDGYCELLDALDELRTQDTGLYLVILNATFQQLRMLAQKEVALYKRTFPNRPKP